MLAEQHGTQVEYSPYVMKIAIPHWRDRISPVFDVARNVLIVEVDHGAELQRQDTAFDVEDPQKRAAQLVWAGVDVLICGAISRPLETAVSSAGIEVIPQRCGNVEEVLAAFSKGQLRQDAFLMPGCCGRRRRLRAGGRRCGRRGTLAEKRGRRDEHE